MGVGRDGGAANKWNMADWYVKGGTAVYTSPISTSAGHTIQVSMDRFTSSLWDVSFYDTKSKNPAAMILTTASSSWQAAQGGVMKIYYLSSCNQLPNATSLTFSGISVYSTAGKKLTPAFTAEKRVSKCSDGVSTTSTATTVKWKP